MATTDGSNGPEDICIRYTNIPDTLEADSDGDPGLAFMTFAGCAFLMLTIFMPASRDFPRAFFAIWSLSVFLGFGLTYLRKVLYRRQIEAGTVLAYRSPSKVLLARAYRVKLDVDAYNTLRQRWGVYIAARDLGVTPVLADEARVLGLLLLIRERTMRQVHLFEVMRQSFEADTRSGAAGVRVALATDEAQGVSDKLRIDVSRCEEDDPLLSEGRQDLEGFLAKA